MPSLTPTHRSDEATWAATTDGIISGGLALIPSGGAVWLAMRNPRFVRATNWQSRTALVVMPALFAYAYAAESKLTHKMEEIAAESSHSQEMAKYTTSIDKRELHDSQKLDETERQLTELYRQSVEQSGVRVVPQLNAFHKASNYFQENPFKILAGLGVPTVAYIFYGRSGQEHIPFQLKVMQTRVMGQFAVISMLLTLMGFKEYMDHNGKFISQEESDRRVEEMHYVRLQLLERLKQEKLHQEEIRHEIEVAHEEDLKEEASHKKEEAQKKEQEQLATTPMVATSAKQ